MISQGSGPPLVLIPGIQGRWEWMEPTVRALSTHFRVLTTSLPGDAGSLMGREEGQSFDEQAGLVDRLLDAQGVEKATVLGVSFGGLVAAYAAAHRPHRVQTLVLVSTPGPDWQPDAWARRYMRAPRLLSPVFVLGAPWRLGPEIVAAAGTFRERVHLARAHAGRVIRAPIRPSLMGARLRLMSSVQARDWCASITAPTLVLTGEPRLDRVVPVDGTRRYGEAIAGATVVELPRTGHLGCVTRAEAFADAVWAFVRSCSDDSSH
jgi:pimeloyl-ACP methyl ester carboxylesterase